MKNYIKKVAKVAKCQNNIYNIIADKLGLSLSACKKVAKVADLDPFCYIAPKKDITFKRCEVMQYFNHYDTNDLNIIVDRVKLLFNLKSYAIITHDKDTENGVLKEPHFHLILTFDESVHLSTISRTLKVPCPFINKIQTTTRLAQEYLIHKNDKSKYQYSPTAVISSFDYIEFLSKRDSEIKKERLNNLALQISNGEIREYNLFQYISVTEYALNKLFFQRCFEYRQHTLHSVSRSLDCVFINGTSGSGKTTLAKRFAEKQGYSVYVSSGGKNPLDDYKGQDCIILDDIRSSTYSLSEFLKLTDLHTSSNVGCRYYNKSIHECKLIICTSVQSLSDFYSSVTKENNEPKVQLLRRFPTYIKMDNEFIYFYEYDKINEKHSYITHQANYITKEFKENSKSLVSEFITALSLPTVDIDIEI